MGSVMMTSKQLCEACKTGDTQVFDKLLYRGGSSFINSRDVLSPLLYAMWHNHPSIVQRILAQQCAVLDITDDYGQTGIHLACRNNSFSVIPLYGKDYRCNPSILNKKDMWGNTALMRAVEMGSLACVLEMNNLSGVDFMTKNSEGESMIEVARKNNHSAVLEYLLSRTRDTSETLKLGELSKELDNIKEAEQLPSAPEFDHPVPSAPPMIQPEEPLGREREDIKDDCRMKGKIKKTGSEEEIVASSVRPRSIIPECPVCLEEMRPPTQIFNCRNGHLICKKCRPKVNKCTHCRVEYTGRATAVEQMIRDMEG